MKIDVLNGENNKKHTKDPKFAKYESCNLHSYWLLAYND